MIYIWIFSRTGHFLDLGDKPLAVIQHGFLRSEENVVPAILNTKRGVWENVFPQYFQYFCMIGVITIHVGRT